MLLSEKSKRQDSIQVIPKTGQRERREYIYIYTHLYIHKLSLEVCTQKPATLVGHGKGPLDW